MHMWKNISLIVVYLLVGVSLIAADRLAEAPVIDVNLAEKETTTVVIDGEEVSITIEEITEENGELVPIITVNDERIVLTDQGKDVQDLPIKIVPVERPKKEDVKDLPEDIVNEEIWVEIIPKHEPFVDLFLAGIQNDLTQVDVKACNSGEIASPALQSGVTMWLDTGSSASKPLPSLLPGDCAAVSFSRQNDFNGASAADAKIAVDPDEKSGDVHRDNNLKKIPMFWKTAVETPVQESLPDLVISDLQVYPLHPTPNDQMYIAFKIRNIGEAPAKLSWTEQGSQNANVMASMVFLNGEAIAFPRPVHPDVTYAYNPNAKEDESQVQVTSWTYKDLTLQPGKEMGISTSYKKQWNQASAIRTGTNVIEVSVDQLFLDQPQSGIVQERDESNNRGKVSFDARPDLSWDTYAYLPFCQRLNGNELFIQTQIDRNGQPDFGPKTDFRATVSYMFVSEDHFYRAEQPEPLFDAVTLYDALYSSAPAVKDTKGREYKIFTREMTEREGSHGFYYALPRVDGTLVIGVVKTVHISTGQEDKSLFFWDFEPEYPSGNECSGGFTVIPKPEEQFVIEAVSGKPKITKRVAASAGTKDKKEKQIIKKEAREEKEDDSSQKKSIVARFMSWLKLVF